MLKVSYVPNGELPPHALRGGDALREGRDYVVLEVFSRPEQSSLFRVESIAGESSALFDSRLFTVSDSKIPSSWRIFDLGNGSFCLCPAPWDEMGFWEAYYDSEPWAVAVYEREKERILRES